jgi:hypothetical protein
MIARVEGAEAMLTAFSKSLVKEAREAKFNAYKARYIGSYFSQCYNGYDESDFAE